MSQMGIHLTTGLIGTNKKLFRKSYLGLGFLIGNIFPDLDFIFLIPLRFIDRELSLLFHRSFTHSVFLVLFILFIASLTRILFKNNVYLFLFGLAIGISVHILFDIFMWFSYVDFLWPLDKTISLYSNLDLPWFTPNIVSSFETACYGLFLLIFRKNYASQDKHLKWIVFLLILLTIIQLPFAFFVRQELFEISAYGLGITLGFSTSIYYLLKYRKALFS